MYLRFTTSLRSLASFVGSSGRRQPTVVPQAVSAAGWSSTSFPVGSVPMSIIPFDSMPFSSRGARFTSTSTCRPTRLLGRIVLRDARYDDARVDAGIHRQFEEFFRLGDLLGGDYPCDADIHLLEVVERYRLLLRFRHGCCRRIGRLGLFELCGACRSMTSSSIFSKSSSGVPVRWPAGMRSLLPKASHPSGSVASIRHIFSAVKGMKGSMAMAVLAVIWRAVWVWWPPVPGRS